MSGAAQWDWKQSDADTSPPGAIKHFGTTSICTLWDTGHVWTHNSECFTKYNKYTMLLCNAKCKSM